MNLRTLVRHLLLVAALCFGTGGWAQEVRWEVLNRFPLLKDGADFARIAQAWPGSATRFVEAPGFTRKLRELLPIGRTAWQPEQGTYDRDVLFRKKHQIRLSVANPAVGEKCEWYVDKQPALTARCSDSVVGEVGARKPFEIALMVDGRWIEAFTYQPIEERLIVAMGDSFASGEGNPDHPAILRPLPASQDWFVKENGKDFIAQDAAWWDQACHRSLLSWPALAALKQAVEDPHGVVQFASFACSGAEVYDGILRAQIDPPGIEEDGRSSEQGLSGGRDGGPGYAPLTFGQGGGAIERPQDYKKGRLKLSQQHALARLLCDRKPTKSGALSLPEVKNGVALNQTYFGRVDLYGCPAEQRRPVDRLYLSIGGNDVGFGGLVKWLITPKQGRNVVGTYLIGLGRGAQGVISPTEARPGIDALPEIYRVLDEVLQKHGISGDRVVMLQYPNPMEGARYEACSLRTRDGNSPFQVIVRELLHSPNFLFGINRPEYEEVVSYFIKPLRRSQVIAAQDAGWRLMDSQSAFRDSQGAPMGYCGVGPACSGGQCPKGDRVRWWTVSPYTGSEPNLEVLSDFDAYDPGRHRGLRYGVDALLTGASVRGTRVSDDWMTNSAHPTANVHARFADLVAPER